MGNSKNNNQRILKQGELHALARPQDVQKLCFQSVYGPGQHSLAYSDQELPAYRHNDSDFLPVDAILEELARVMQDKKKDKAETKAVVLAIDGPAASGKTTLASKLKDIMGASVIHMDDFFLPPALRVEERLREAGGNVHYERFQQEVLPFLKMGKDFTYRRFDCSRMEYGKDVEVVYTPILIVEGSYSAHPNFGKYMDLLAYCTIDAKDQMERIRVRNGEEGARRFQERWIPMENKYFKEFMIQEKADVVIRADSRY